MARRTNFGRLDVLVNCAAAYKERRLEDVTAADVRYTFEAKLLLPWAHAEYIHLVRSAADGQVFGLISDVADRYRNRRKAPRDLEIQPAGEHDTWEGLCESKRLPRSDCTGPATNGRKPMTQKPRPSGPADYVHIQVAPEQKAPVRFTFFWTTSGPWEGRDFPVGIERARAREFVENP